MEIDSEPDTQVLYVGGLSPDTTSDDLRKAFNGVSLLGLSVITLPNTSPGPPACIGHAYVTVAMEHAQQASGVEQVGRNHVCVFPVDIAAWSAEDAEGEADDAAAAAAAAAAVAAAAAGGQPIDAMEAVTAAQAEAESWKATAAAGSNGAVEMGTAPPPPPPPQQQQQQQQHQQDVPVPLPPPGTSAQTAAEPPAAAAGGGAGAGAPTAAALGLPAVAPSNAYLHQAIEALRSEILGGGGRVGYNGKRLAVVLNECCLKLKLVPQPVEGPGPAGGAPFQCVLHLLEGGTTVVTGVGGGANKKDAKHAASESALNGLLQSGRVSQYDVVASLRQVQSHLVLPPAAAAPPALAPPPPGSAVPMAAPPAAAGPAVAPYVSYAPVPPPTAAPGARPTAAMTSTEALMRLGLYPRAMATMTAVHAIGTESARSKTPLMLVNEFASKRRLNLQWPDLYASASSIGPFKFTAALVDVTGGVMASAPGPELPAKQEARHAAAAAVMEQLLASGQAVQADFMPR